MCLADLLTLPGVHLVSESLPQRVLCVTAQGLFTSYLLANNPWAFGIEKSRQILLLVPLWTLHRWCSTQCKSRFLRFFFLKTLGLKKDFLNQLSSAQMCPLPVLAVDDLCLEQFGITTRPKQKGFSFCCHGMFGISLVGLVINSKYLNILEV